MNDGKIAATFRLSPTATRLIRELAQEGGSNKTEVVEAAIRRLASNKTFRVMNQGQLVLKPKRATAK